MCVIAVGAYLQYGGDRRRLIVAELVTLRYQAFHEGIGRSSPGRHHATPYDGLDRRTLDRRHLAVSPRPATRPGRPNRIAIPQLDVIAPVVGIKAAGGALTPPSDPSTVGWWTAGAQPGAVRGSAIITGHTVHDGGGAFDNLDKLEPGSVVAVSTVRGSLRYRVATVATYRKATLAKRAAQLFDQSVRGRLVLVTCEDWNGEVYLSNVVVVAKPMA